MSVRKPTSSADPFGTAELRDATLSAWRSSPTRLAEDIAAEAELRSIGYRSSLCTELAANAADAAVAVAASGRIAVWLDDTRLHIANTGAPLDAAGVRSLTALRVSPKHPGTGSVGRFGVGFRATSFLDRVEVRSTTGSIEFDRRRSAALARAAGITVADDSAVPAQRMAWPTANEPSTGFDTEVVLHVDDRARAAELLAEFAAQAPDLLLELPSLLGIEVDGSLYEPDVDGDLTTLLRDGEVIAEWLGTDVDGTRWLVPIVDGYPVPLGEDVLRSPTPTVIPLALPARVITSLPVTPDRRELYPDTDIAMAADGYPQLVALVPDAAKLDLIPGPALGAAGEADARLRAAIDDALSRSAWLPAATGEALRPDRAWVLPDLSPELADCLGEVIEPLAHPLVSDRRRLSQLVRLGARELSLAQLADLLAGHDREHAWWVRLYTALTPFVRDAADAAELGALPVPAADGRLRRGARGMVLLDAPAAGDLVLPWLVTVAAEAYHPLLERLGLDRIDVGTALAEDGLRQILADDPADDRVREAVLRLLAADESAAVPSWLGALELPDTDGELRPADELLLPESPLAAVLIDDSPFGIVETACVARYGSSTLRRIGVGWGFTTVSDQLPVGPDHDLPDEERWWDSLAVPPETLVAVRDLDLVDPDHWERALGLLAADPDLAELLADPAGYTCWWLRRYAEYDGRTLRTLRHPDDHGFTGLFDAIDSRYADELRSLLVRERPEDAEEVELWFEQLADPARSIAPGVAVRAHRAIMLAWADGRFAIDEVSPPAGVRTLAGTVSSEALVLDRPWHADVLAPEEAVVAGLDADPRAATRFAELVDLDLAGEQLQVVVDEPGTAMDPDGRDAVALATSTGWTLVAPLRVHDELSVTVLRGSARRRVRLPRWVDSAGTLHVQLPSG